MILWFHSWSDEFSDVSFKQFSFMLWYLNSNAFVFNHGISIEKSSTFYKTHFRLHYCSRFKCYFSSKGYVTRSVRNVSGKQKKSNIRNSISTLSKISIYSNLKQAQIVSPLFLLTIQNEEIRCSKRYQQNSAYTFGQSI